MFKLEFDREAANQIPDVHIFQAHQEKVYEILCVDNFDSFIEFLGDDYENTLAEIFARNYCKTKEEYDYLDGVALKALTPVKIHYASIYSGYLLGMQKMSPPQRDFREDQIIRSFNNVMRHVSADLGHIALGLRDKPLPSPSKLAKEKKPADHVHGYDLRNLFPPFANDRLNGEDDIALMSSMICVQELLVDSIQDQASYLSFLDGDLVVDLAREFAEQESFDKASFKKLDKIATYLLEQIRIKHNAKSLTDQETCDDYETFIQDSIGLLKIDLQRISVELAELAHAIDYKRPTVRPNWGPHQTL